MKVDIWVQTSQLGPLPKFLYLGIVQISKLEHLLIWLGQSKTTKSQEEGWGGWGLIRVSPGNPQSTEELVAQSHHWQMKYHMRCIFDGIIVKMVWNFNHIRNHRLTEKDCLEPRVQIPLLELLQSVCVTTAVLWSLLGSLLKFRCVKRQKATALRCHRTWVTEHCPHPKEPCRVTVIVC